MMILNVQKNLCFPGSYINPLPFFYYFVFSELTKKLELAKCLTKESLDICENIFFDSSNSDYENNMNQWFNNVSIVFKIVFFSCKRMRYN